MGVCTCCSASSIDPKVLDTVNLTISLLLLHFLQHSCEVGLLGLLADLLLINLAYRLLKLFTEEIITLDVRLDHIKLVQSLSNGREDLLLLGSSATHGTLCAIWQILVCDEVLLLGVNLLPKTLYGHADDTVLACLLQESLRLVLIPNQ